ncbi:MAG: flagellar protein FliO/FliZ [Bacillota bacterium]|nr:flagellar protein FliO/FliZ [Bacillota bacterium]MDK2925035.1 flagellar protein FliO/FliZ [Bacillota bacterium]MDK2959822.1 flagellar protein FliO/FliZ [Bacillota bacterium]
MPCMLGRAFALTLALAIICATGEVVLASPLPGAVIETAAPTSPTPGYPAAQPGDQPAAFNPAALILRMLAGLGLVLFLLYLVTRYLSQRLGLPRGAGRYLAVLDTLPLGPGKGILLVRAGKRQFLLGVSGERITVLGELNEGDVSFGPEVAGFQEALSRAAQKGVRFMPEGLWREAAAALRRQVNRLHERRQDSEEDNL